MKRTYLILTLLFIMGSGQFLSAQFKEVPYETRTKLKSNKLIFGFINPKNFSLTHHLSASYQTFGGNSVSLTSYTGTLSYRILDNLKLSADVTMQYSPFASVSSNSAFNREFQNSLAGVYLSRVSLDYKPFRDIYIHFDYVNRNSGLYWYNDNYYMRDDF